MSDIQKVEAVPLPNDIEQEFVDFKIIRENWNKYELDDGSIIRTRFILSQIVSTEEPAPQDDDLNLGFMEPRIITSIFAPIDKRGTPDRNYSVPELEKFVINKDCKIINKTINDPSIYMTESMLIFVYNVIDRIEKTSKFSASGMPHYIVRTKNQIMMHKIPSVEEFEKAVGEKNISN